jgi:DNA-binding cell septation regulator SpoVG
VTGDCHILRWQSYINPAGTMRGFVSVALPSGLVIHGIKLMIGSQGVPWLALPALKRLDRDGKPVWDAVIEFGSRSDRDRFQQQVLGALRRSHPAAFSPSVQAGEVAPGAPPASVQGSKSS